MAVLDQIKELSTRDALVAMEALWDRLQACEDDLLSPDWHRDELARRDGLVSQGSASFSSWDEAKERIRKRIQ